MSASTEENLRTTAVIHSLVHNAQEPIRRYFNADSCVASTRIGLDVLAYFGVRARPLPLSILIFNEEAVQILEDGQTMDDLARLMHNIPVDVEGGPWSMGLGLGGDPEPNKWPGHLVIEVPQGHCLIDLSVGQVSRPHKKLQFDNPVLWFCDDDEWWSGERPFSLPQVFSNEETGDRIMVIFDREDHLGTFGDYTRFANWHRRSVIPGDVFKPITGEIIRLIKKDLEAS